MTTPTSDRASDFAALASRRPRRGQLYTDPEIFEWEMEKIFYRTWVWVAHESEIPEAGSFKMATIGRQPVIVNRDRKGNFNVLLNRCRHRGRQRLRSPKGKANGFTCPYHSWSYSPGRQPARHPVPGRLRRRCWKRRTCRCSACASKATPA